MPRLYDLFADDDKPGHLIVDTRCGDYVEVFYAPSRERVNCGRSCTTRKPGVASHCAIESRYCTLMRETTNSR